MIITISTLVSMSEHLLGAGIILDIFQTLSCVIPVTVLHNVYYPDWKWQSHACRLEIPTRPHVNGCWTWDTSLPRVKESSHPVLGLSLCVGISSPIQM